MKIAIYILFTLILGVCVAYATMVCPQCGKTYPDDAAYCDDDGTKLERLVERNKLGYELKTIGDIRLVHLPKGSFEMGSDESDAYEDEKPIHSVNINSFWIGEREITIGQYVAFLNKIKPSESQLELWINFSDSTHLIHRAGMYSADKGWDDHPVVYVSWYGAEAFCKSYGLRLPTEEEWEYAAGGPKHYKYPWGDKWDLNKSCNNKNQNGGVPPTETAKRFDSYGYGLYNMAGNVWEMTSDQYNAYPGGKRNGYMGGDYMVMRGGSWNTGDRDSRCSVRQWGKSGICGNSLGFRVAGD